MAIPDADAFHFAMFLRLPNHHRISSTERELALSGVGEQDRLLLSPESGSNLDQTVHLMLAGHGYETRHQAEAAARDAQKAFTLAALECNVGIEWEDPTEPPSVWKGYRAWGRVHGGGRGMLVGGITADRFRDCFRAWSTRRFDLSGEEQTCAALLADFHFDLSSRSRVLLAHAAIEALCPRRLESDDIRRAIASLVQYLGTLGTAETVRSRLTKRLEVSQYMSDTARCSPFIGELLGDEQREAFLHLSRERGKIAHLGRQDDGGLGFRLHQLAREMLIKSISLRIDSSIHPAGAPE